MHPRNNSYVVQDGSVIIFCSTSKCGCAILIDGWFSLLLFILIHDDYILLLHNLPSICFIVTLLIFSIVIISFDAFILYYLYTMLLGSFGSDPLYVGAVGSDTDPLLPESEAYLETPIVDDHGWRTGDLADQPAD